MVPPTPTILEVQICFFSRSSVSLISLRRGATANQMKKAMKNPTHEQWKALMWGREKLQSLIWLARSSWSGSTSRAYSLYFFHSVCEINKNGRRQNQIQSVSWCWNASIWLCWTYRSSSVDFSHFLCFSLEVCAWKQIYDSDRNIFLSSEKSNDESAVDILRTFGGRGSNRTRKCTTILPRHVHILDVQNSTSAFFDVHKFRNFGFFVRLMFALMFSKIIATVHFLRDCTMSKKPRVLRFWLPVSPSRYASSHFF